VIRAKSILVGLVFPDFKVAARIERLNQMLALEIERLNRLNQMDAQHIERLKEMFK